MKNWVRYSTGENTSEILNLDYAKRFRHVNADTESMFEVFIEDSSFSIMFSVDPDAYRTVAAYLRDTAGVQLD